jgi:hypothetical protein
MQFPMATVKKNALYMYEICYGSSKNGWSKYVEQSQEITSQDLDLSDTDLC